MSFVRGLPHDPRRRLAREPAAHASRSSRSLLSYASAPLTPLALKRVTDAALGARRSARRRTGRSSCRCSRSLNRDRRPPPARAVRRGRRPERDQPRPTTSPTIAHGSGRARAPREPEVRGRARADPQRGHRSATWRFARPSCRSASSSQLHVTMVLLATVQPILLLLLLFAIPPLVATRWAWQHFNKRWQASAETARRAGTTADLSLRADAGEGGARSSASATSCGDASARRAPRSRRPRSSAPESAACSRRRRASSCS